MRSRHGFTLTELLIVIAIMLTLAGITLAVYNTGRSSDRLRSAARVSQSAFLGAKDRAMHAKAFRGVRIIRDARGWVLDPATNQWRDGSSVTFANGFPALVSGFAYTQPINHDSYSATTVQLERQDANQDSIPDSADVLIVHGLGTGVDWNSVSTWFSSPGQIRIPAGTGQWYQFTIDTSGPYALGAGNQYLRLTTPFNGGTPTFPFPANIVAYPTSSTSTNSCDIQFGNEVLPFHQPIALPAGVVIDLRYCSANLQYLAGGNVSNPPGGAQPGLPPNVDISFSPRGSIAGATGGMGAFYFCLRDIKDATGPSTINTGNPPISLAGSTPRDPCDPAAEGECLVLAVNPATGLVQTYDADLTDANGDGMVDNLFRFAQLGKAAGR